MIWAVCGGFCLQLLLGFGLNLLDFVDFGVFCGFLRFVLCLFCSLGCLRLVTVTLVFLWAVYAENCCLVLLVWGWDLLFSRF